MSRSGLLVLAAHAALAAFAGCADPTPTDNALVLRAIDHYRAEGFAPPSLQVDVEQRDTGSFFDNSGHVEGDRYKIRVEESRLPTMIVAICHEVFHYFQLSYFSLDIRGAGARTWLTEPTAHAMAARCAGRALSFRCPRPGEPVLDDWRLAARYWDFLEQRDPGLIRDYFGSLGERGPSKTGFVAWLERRTGATHEATETAFREACR